MSIGGSITRLAFSLWCLVENYELHSWQTNGNPAKAACRPWTERWLYSSAKQPNVAVTFFVPKCSEKDKKAAGKHNIRIVEAKERVGFDEPLDWLSFPSKDLVTDEIIAWGDARGENWKYRFTQRVLSAVSNGVSSCHRKCWSVVISSSETSGKFRCQIRVQPIYYVRSRREALWRITGLAPRKGFALFLIIAPSTCTCTR